MDTREHNIHLAIADLESGVLKSQRQASLTYGIPRSTLQARLGGTPNRRAAHRHQQRLSPKQEQVLVDWILDGDRHAQPPSPARVREMATRILRLNHDHEPLGLRWMKSFLQRQPRVSSIVGRSIKASRATAADPDLVQQFLVLVEGIRIELGIQVEDIWNMDETRVALGVCTKCRANPPS
jgi:hypothetical protein